MNRAAREALERAQDTDEWSDMDIAIKGPLAMHYLDMCTAIEAHRKPDRSAILRMAGNIASGMCADSNGFAYRMDDGGNAQRQRIAAASVDIARRIMACVDGTSER